MQQEDQIRDLQAEMRNIKVLAEARTTKVGVSGNTGGNSNTRTKNSHVQWPTNPTEKS